MHGQAKECIQTPMMQKPVLILSFLVVQICLNDRGDKSSTDTLTRHMEAFTYTIVRRCEIGSVAITWFPRTILFPICKSDSGDEVNLAQRTRSRRRRISTSASPTNWGNTRMLTGIDIKHGRILWYKVVAYRISTNAPRVMSITQPLAHHQNVPNYSWWCNHHLWWGWWLGVLSRNTRSRRYQRCGGHIQGKGQSHRWYRLNT